MLCYPRFIFIITLFCFLISPEGWSEEDAPEEMSAEGEAADGAAEADEKEARVGSLNREQLRQLAMASEAREHEIVWLDVTYPNKDASVPAGDEGSGKHQVLALEQKPRVPKDQSQGAVIILHDKEQHADWPFLIRPLRMQLPDAGWFTLTVNLPYDDVRDIPERELEPKQRDAIELNPALRARLQAASARNPPPSSAQTDGASVDEVAESEAPAGPEDTQEESVDIDLADKPKKRLPYRERALVHLKAALERVNQEGYRNIIVIGYRAGADIALEYVKPLASQIRKQGFGLVMIDPKIQLGYQTDLSAALGQNFRAPVLDVVNGSDLDSRVAAAEREAGARIANAKLYRQIRLVATDSGVFQQTLIRRIRSWLGKYAPGMSARQIRNP